MAKVGSIGLVRASGSSALVGTSRETATKVLGDFADRGLIRLGRGRITLLDPARITTEAGDG